MSEDMDSAVNDALGQYQCIAALTAENERLQKLVDTGALDRLEMRTKLNAAELRIAELRRALERYGDHESECILSNFDALDGKRWKLGGKWYEFKPECTCGLDAALEDKP